MLVHTEWRLESQKGAQTQGERRTVRRVACKSFPTSGESLASDAGQALDLGHNPGLGEHIPIERHAEHAVQPVHSEKVTLSSSVATLREAPAVPRRQLLEVELVAFEIKHRDPVFAVLLVRAHGGRADRRQPLSLGIDARAPHLHRRFPASANVQV